MPNNGILTTADYLKRRGDPLIGLVNDVINNAPEFRLFPALLKQATTYFISRVIANPTVQFADVNQGVNLSASQFDMITAQMKLINSQMAIRKSFTLLDRSNPLENILTGEATRVIRQAFINMGQQIYYGLSADTKGFLGLQSMISGLSGFEVDAAVVAGNSANAAGCNSSAYLLRLSEEGVSISLGNNADINLTPWTEQMLPVTNPDGSTGYDTVYASSFMGFFGLTVASNFSAWRVKNISSKVSSGGAAKNPLTDIVGEQLVALIPLQFRENLHWFMSRDAAFSLQASRQAVTTQITTAEGTYGPSPIPTMLAGYPVTITESLRNPVQTLGGE